MAPIDHTVTFTSSLAPDAAREKALAWFSTYTYKVEDDQPGALTVYTGSQAKMRLLGGAFIAASSLPTRTTLAIAPSGSGSEVTVTTHDSVGFGVKTGMKKKYQQWLIDIGEGLRAALA